MFRLILLVFAFTAALSAGQVFGRNWSEQFAQIDSLVESGLADSAEQLLQQTIEQTENESGRSDSTIDIEFWRDGVSYRLYYRSFTDAEMFYTQLAYASEKIHDSPNLEHASHLRKLGAVYKILGKYREAIAIQRQALAAAEAAVGLNAKEIVAYLNDLADVLCIMAEYKEADSLAQQALGIAKDKLGGDHPSVARSLEVIGQVLMLGVDLIEAGPLFERALKIREDRLGSDHPDVAVSLRLVGGTYWKIGRVNDADATLRRSLQIVEATFGPEHPEVAKSLEQLGEYYYLCLWRHQDAEEIFKRVTDIRKETFGPSHPATALSVLAKAKTKSALAKFSEAEVLLQEALPIVRRTLGTGHDRVSFGLTILARAKMHAHEITAALDLYQQAITILESRRESQSLQMAGILTSLGELHYVMHSWEKADSTLGLAYSLFYSSGSPIHLANIFLSQGHLKLSSNQFSVASTYFRQCLNIIQDLHGGKHPIAVYASRSLASCLAREGKIDEAEAMLLQALETSKEVLSVDNANHGALLGSIGNEFAYLGKLDEAERFCRQAYTLLEKVLGPDHHVCFNNLNRIAAILAAQGKYEQSLDCYRNLLNVRRRQLRTVLGVASESDKATFVQSYEPILSDLLSLTLLYDTPPSRELSMGMVLKGKALVEEASMFERQAAYCSHDATVMNLVDSLSEVRTGAANIILSGSADNDCLSALYAAQDSMETILSQKCGEFGNELVFRDFTVADVATALPKDAALVEYYRYYLYDFDSMQYVHASPGEYMVRYVALTLNHKGEISIVDLCRREEIDSLITLAREMIYDAPGIIRSSKATLAEERLNKTTGQLRELILDPLSEQLEGATSLYISPDGMLNLLPFEILPLEDGSYAIEKYQISYLSSGRDLLRYIRPIETPSEVFVMADPDFDHHGLAEANVISQAVVGDEELLPPLAYLLRGTGGCLQGLMRRLDQSRIEGEQVAESFRRHSQSSVVELYGSQASEANLKRLDTPLAVLHLATHGYFCPYSDELSEHYENPLLRSGLVLAGYNSYLVNDSARVPNGEDGILTAYEVSGLNLSETELVTLSACESGLSEGYTCDGLYGLRRAFQHAGAQSVIMSLWRVPDRETRLLMGSFYDHWLSGDTKREALRQAALEVLRSSREALGRGHPLLWGGFILTGNPY